MSKGIQLYDAEGKVFAYPYYQIGDLYLTTISTNPSAIFGGSWELFGKGRVLVCVDPEQEEFNIVKKTGGSKYMQAHTHVLNLAANAGSGNITGTGYGVVPTTYNRYPVTADNPTSGEFKGWGIKTSGAGDSGNLPPYITCYIWRRIA